jgi:hypothetical protein
MLLPPEVSAPEFQLSWAPDGTAVCVQGITSTEGAVVRYTLDGTEPKPNSPTNAPILTAPGTVGAVGFRKDTIPSALRVARIEQLLPPLWTLADGCLVFESEVPGAVIEYALPNEAWVVYRAPLPVAGLPPVITRSRKAGYLTSPQGRIDF